MRTTKVRSKLSLLLIALAALIAIPAVVALADNVQNDVANSIDPNDQGKKVLSVTKGQTSAPVDYEIHATSGDVGVPGDTTGRNGENCNLVWDGEAQVTISGLPTGVTVQDTAAPPNDLSAPHLSFTSCDTPQAVQFKVASSVAAGDYPIGVADLSTGTTDPGTSDGYNEQPAAFILRVIAPVSTNNAPTVSTAAADASGDEGSPLTTNGAFSDQDGDTLTITKTAGEGTVTPSTTTPGRWDWSYTPTDNGTGTVTVQAVDGKGGTAVDEFSWSAANVAPTITGISALPQNALVNQNISFTGTATDPSSVDTTEGFTWQWAKDGSTTYTSGSNPYSTSFSTCGPHSVSAKAADKDNGISDPFSLSTPVQVYNASFQAPVDGAPYINSVQKDRVVPVKISVGCNGTNLTNLTPSITLLKGDVTPGQETTTDEIESYSVSSADTQGFMRTADGGYIYNLKVPNVASTAYTIRVNPFGTQATPNPAGSAMYALLKTKK